LAIVTASKNGSVSEEGHFRFYYDKYYIQCRRKGLMLTMGKQADLPCRVDD